MTIFASLILAFALLTATEWEAAMGNAAYAGNLQIAAGACAFVTCCSGWWIFTAQILAAVDFPIQLPVGDLSQMITGYSAKQTQDKEYA